MLRILGLEECKDTPVGGNYVTGLSGGERKRTSIGYDLMTDPSVIVLDEPTSGLDSQTAYSIVKHLKHLAHIKNINIIMSVHQPSSEIVQLCDRVMCMSEGSVIFDGPCDKSFISYFSKIGL